MRKPASIYSHFFSIFSDWYPNPYDTSVDDLLFLQQVKDEPDYQRFQQWNTALELALKNNREELRKTITKNSKGALQAYREHLLAYQDNDTQENMLSPFYYNKQLTKSENQLKQTFALDDENPFSEAKKHLKEILKAQTEQAALYFYHDVMNGLIDYYLMDRTKQQDADEMLRDLLNYYKDLVGNSLLEEIRIEIEGLIKKSENFYQQEKNPFDRLPSKIMKRIFLEVETIFENFSETRVEENNEKEEESFTTRFYNKVQETKSALQSSLRNTTDRARKIAAIGAAAISLAQPGFAQSTQTTESDESSSTDEQEDDDTIIVSKRQSSIPIVSTPFYMNEVGNHPVNSSAFTVQLVGDLIYMANSENGLLIFNVSDPRIPIQVGSYPTQFAYDIAVLNNRAYLADHSAGLKIIDVTNPESPNLLGSHDTSGFSYGVAVSGSGNFAYVADYVVGLHLFNVTNPSAITLLSTYDTPGAALKVVLSATNNTAFIADFDGSLQVVDISNANAPTFMGSYNTPSLTLDITKAGNYVYLADHLSGMQRANVSTPNNPTPAGNYKPSNITASAQGIDIADNVLYLAYSTSGLHALDADSLIPLAVYTTPTVNARSVAISRHNVYLSDEDYGLRILVADFVPTLLANRLTIQQGQTRILDSSNLNASDRDDEDSTLTYVIEETQSDSLHGSFRDRNNGNAIVTEFTKQQVDNYEIEFRHDGSLLPPDYFVRVEDGLVSSTEDYPDINFSLLPTPTPAPGPTPATTTTITSTTFTPTTTTATAGTSTITTIDPTTTGITITQNIDSSSSSVESSNLLTILLLTFGGTACLACVVAALFVWRLYRNNNQDDDDAEYGTTTTDGTVYEDLTKVTDQLNKEKIDKLSRDSKKIQQEYAGESAYQNTTEANRRAQAGNKNDTTDFSDIDLSNTDEEDTYQNVTKVAKKAKKTHQSQKKYAKDQKKEQEIDQEKENYQNIATVEDVIRTSKRNLYVSDYQNTSVVNQQIQQSNGHASPPSDYHDNISEVNRQIQKGKKDKNDDVIKYQQIPSDSALLTKQGVFNGKKTSNHNSNDNEVEMTEKMHL